MKKHSIDTYENGNTLDFWLYYYRNNFKSNIEFLGAGKKDYMVELKKHYSDLLKSKDNAIDNLNSDNYHIKHSAIGLLNQLKAIEQILN